MGATVATFRVGKLLNGLFELAWIKDVAGVYICKVSHINTKEGAGLGE